MKTFRFLNGDVRYWLFFYASLAAVIAAPWSVLKLGGPLFWAFVALAVPVFGATLLWCMAAAHREKLITAIKVSAGYQLANDDVGTYYPSSGVFQRTIFWIQQNASPLRRYKFKADPDKGVTIIDEESGKLLEYVRHIPTQQMP